MLFTACTTVKQTPSYIYSTLYVGICKPSGKLFSKRFRERTRSKFQDTCLYLVTRYHHHLYNSIRLGKWAQLVCDKTLHSRPLKELFIFSYTQPSLSIYPYIILMDSVQDIMMASDEGFGPIWVLSFRALYSNMRGTGEKKSESKERRTEKKGPVGWKEDDKSKAHLVYMGMYTASS